MTVRGRMFAVLMLAAALAQRQSTQGLITGTIRDSESGRPISLTSKLGGGR